MIQNATESSSKYIIPKVYFQEAVVGSELILFMLRNLGPRTPLYNALKTGEGVSKAKEALLQARMARILRSTDWNEKTKKPILWQAPKI